MQSAHSSVSNSQSVNPALHSTGANSRVQQEITDGELDAIIKLIKTHTGITMNPSKRQLIMRRLQSRLKAVGLQSYSAYIEYLKQGNAVELLEFSNAVTTNLTSFFREMHHFDYLKETIIPEIIQKKSRTSKRLRIWSAGCSTGEEPYSIAMTLRNMIQDLPKWDIKILATDIDSNVLQTSKNGCYNKQRVEKIPQNFLHRYFSEKVQGKETIYTAGNDLKNLIKFNRLNLMEPWPMKGQFDVIFCRNVIIYFDKDTQRKLVDRYANVVTDDGFLILGHSETLLNVSTRFELIGKTIYRKV